MSNTVIQALRGFPEDDRHYNMFTRQVFSRRQKIWNLCVFGFVCLAAVAAHGAGLF